MAYIFCAYYTINTPYQDEAKGLEESLKKHLLPYEITGIPNQGGFQENTHYKAYFIKQMLIRHFPKDVIYIDVDARVRQHPALFDAFQGDIGVVYCNDFAHELLSSSLYLSNNPKIMELVERWISYQFDFPIIWDQKVLQYVLKNSSDLNLKLVEFPPAYCKIFDLMKEAGDPVIEQFQVSRKYKNNI